LDPRIGQKKRRTPSVELMLEGLRRWTEKRQQEDPDASVVKGRVAAEIEGYIGPYATGRILATVKDRSKLFPTLEPVLSIFLGCKAAGRLIERVIDAAIVRI
jgi:hypothetical protein